MKSAISPQTGEPQTMNKYVLTLTYAFESKSEAHARRIVRQLEKELPMDVKLDCLRVVTEHNSKIYTDSVRYYR